MIKFLIKYNVSQFWLALTTIFKRTVFVRFIFIIIYFILVRVISYMLIICPDFITFNLFILFITFILEHLLSNYKTYYVNITNIICSIKNNKLYSFYFFVISRILVTLLIFITFIVLIYINIDTINFYLIPLFYLSLTEIWFSFFIEHVIVYMNNGSNFSNFFGGNGMGGNSQFNEPKGPRGPKGPESSHSYQSHLSRNYNNSDENQNNFSNSEAELAYYEGLNKLDLKYPHKHSGQELNKVKLQYPDIHSEQANADIAECMKKKLMSFLEEKQNASSLSKQGNDPKRIIFSITENDSPFSLQDRLYLANKIRAKYNSATDGKTKNLYTPLYHDIRLESDGVNRFDGGINLRRINKIFD